ncbi:MAG TPA: hypothetical protein VE566_03015 [Nitrososphaeraceae archaeon]|nr:hypothetical protein [Nitrososphaeraceae archaeon]
MHNSNILVILLLVGTFFTSTITMLPAAYSERGDDDGRSGDENKQKVEDDSAGAIADCDENEVERDDFDCIAAAATEESEVGTGDGGTPTPDGLFTISGQGSGTYTCLESSEDASISISAEEAEDGSVTGSVTISLVSGESTAPVTGGITDGNTFSLTGETGTGILCGFEVQQFEVSGDCGTGATVSYEETDASGTFTGNVDCTLLA